jgi:Peptidase family M28
VGLQRPSGTTRALVIPAFLLALCLALSFPSFACAAAPTFNQAVNELVASGYPQTVESHICSLGTSDLGFRTAGSTADEAAAGYIRDQMIAAGLDARLEAVPVDVTEFHSASVTVGDRVMPAVPWVGAPGTSEPITAKVVYVHSATKAAMDAAGDVAGKICLVDYDTERYYPSIQGAECAARGAVAMILTRAAGLTIGLYGAAGALGAMDACWNLSWGPMLYVSQADGDWLKARLAAGPVTATFSSDVTVRLGSAGAVGHNVVGKLPGSDGGRQAVLITAHHDAHFTGGVDNTSSLAGMLLMAKAMKMSGYTPGRTIIFMATTGEEGGQTNAYYDWMYGAFYAAAIAHPDWAGSVVCDFNLEMLGYDRRPVLWAVASPELRRWYLTMARSHPEAGAYASLSNIGSEFAQSDSAPFTAAGIPSICLQTPWWNYYYVKQYHTQYDTQSLVDFDYLGRNVKFLQHLVVAVDSDDQVLPYNLSSRARQVARQVDESALYRLGATPGVVARLTRAIKAFSQAARSYQRRQRAIWRSRRPRVNSLLLRIEKALNKRFTAIDVWDIAIYPHRQVQRDVEGLSAAIAALGSKPHPAAARAALRNVSMTYYGAHFDRTAYRSELARHLPGYPKLNFGGMAQLAPFVDVMSQYGKIRAGHYARARRGLCKIRDRELKELDARLLAMARTLEYETPLVARLK